MRARLILALAVVCVVAGLLASSVILSRQVSRLRSERDLYRSNVSVLMTDAEQYRVRDSLSAARVEALQLTLREYERFRADDAALVRDLRGRLRDLNSVVSAQMRTIEELRGQVRDSVIVLPGDTVLIPVRCIDITTEWIDLHGCATPAGQFSGTLSVTEDIIVTEHVERARFLGFLWKTKRVKSRAFDIVSRNPHTEIVGFDVVTLRK